MYIEQLLLQPLERDRTTEITAIMFTGKQDESVSIEAIEDILEESGGLRLLGTLAEVMQEQGYTSALIKPCPLLLHSYVLVWDYNLPLYPAFDMASVVYLGALPNERKIFVIGQEAEILSEAQWKNPIILADAIVRAQINPYRLKIPQFPIDSNIEP